MWILFTEFVREEQKIQTEIGKRGDDKETADEDSV